MRKLLIVVGALVFPLHAWAQVQQQQPTASASLAGQLATMLAMAVDERAAALAKSDDLQKQIDGLKKQIEDLKAKEPAKP